MTFISLVWSESQLKKPLLMMMKIELVTIKCDHIKMEAFADEFNTAGKLKSVIQW